MGTRSATETVVGIFVAFFEQKTWSQAELARRLNVGVRVVRERLEELRQKGTIPLEREEDLPHVYWSVPSSWAPGGVFLVGDEAGQVLRLLARLPQSAERDRLLRRFTGYVGESPVPNATPLRGNEHVLYVIESAVSQRLPIRFDYFATSRGDHRERVASVHRVLGGDHWRFVATCHDRNQLCFFRVDNVLSATLASEESFRAVDELTVERFCATSLNGFASLGEPVAVWFDVRYPEARWVRKNLPNEEQFTTKELENGTRFNCSTTAVEQLARFVVGLGPAVTACSSELRGNVLLIARQVLENLEERRENGVAR
jgi:predicted DNA-binding transcriptional regulator YafY